MLESGHLLTGPGEVLRRYPLTVSDMPGYADSTFQQFAAVTMSRVFAYARVSTVEQITENQREQIAQAGYAIDGRRFVEEKVSGSVPASQRNPSDPSSWGKVGRNEPCPCGSGKKYKHCHGRYA